MPLPACKMKRSGGNLMLTNLLSWEYSPNKYYPLSLINQNNNKKIVKQVIPQSLSPPGTVPWQQQTSSSHSNGPPSPTSMSSGCSSPGYSPSRGLDLSGSSSSFSDRKAAVYNYKGGPVHEWTKEQVCLIIKIKISFKSIINKCYKNSQIYLRFP